MIAVYQQLTHGGPGGAVEVVVTGPALFAPDSDAAGLLAAAMRDAAEEAGQAAVERARASYSPPEIVAGWGFEVQAGPGGAQIGLTQTSALWGFVEFPTAPHVIEAHGAVLAWTGGDGATHFARTVHHPGTPGKDRLPAQEAALLKGFAAAVDRRLGPLLGGE